MSSLNRRLCVVCSESVSVLLYYQAYILYMTDLLYFSLYMSNCRQNHIFYHDKCARLYYWLRYLGKVIADVFYIIILQCCASVFLALIEERILYSSLISVQDSVHFVLLVKDIVV